MDIDKFITDYEKKVEFSQKYFEDCFKTKLIPQIAFKNNIIPFEKKEIYKQKEIEFQIFEKYCSFRIENIKLKYSFVYINGYPNLSFDKYFLADYIQSSIADGSLSECMIYEEINKLSDYLLEEIKDYENIIKYLEKKLQKSFGKLNIPYHVAVHRKMIPSSGEIEDIESKIKYKFHGTGCLMLFKNFKVDFDFEFIERNYYEGFHRHKLSYFLESKLLKRDIIKKEWVVNGLLQELCNNNLIFPAALNKNYEFKTK